MYTSGSANIRLDDRPRVDCQMFWTKSLFLPLSPEKTHTLSLSFYGDYNVASCIPTRSTFGEYNTFLGEKSKKKNKKSYCNFFAKIMMGHNIIDEEKVMS